MFPKKQKGYIIIFELIELFVRLFGLLIDLTKSIGRALLIIGGLGFFVYAIYFVVKFW